MKNRLVSFRASKEWITRSLTTHVMSVALDSTEVVRACDWNCLLAVGGSLAGREVARGISRRSDGSRRHSSTVERRQTGSIGLLLRNRPERVTPA